MKRIKVNIKLSMNLLGGDAIKTILQESATFFIGIYSRKGVTHAKITNGKQVKFCNSHVLSINVSTIICKSRENEH